MDAVCDDTTLLPNPSFIDHVMSVGDPVLWYQFENTNDTYTVQNTPPHEFNGWAYCKERKYTVLSIVNVTTPTATLRSLSPPIVEVDFENLFVKVTANDKNYFGIFDVTI